MVNDLYKGFLVSTTAIRTTTTVSPLRDTYHLVRERVYQGSLDFVQILIGLRNERATGTLEIALSQGGVCRVRFREEQDIRYAPSHP
jgi:hypothetical protein